jgi:outer membrane protein assembly factor BamA
MLIYLLMICTLAYPITDATLALESDSAETRRSENARFGCAQPTGEQAAIIREAVANDYSIRRLEFIGNENIRDGVLRKRMRALQEGEKFKRSNLVSSLKNVSRLKSLHDVSFSDVVLRLEKSDKLMDIVICFREKKK